MKNACKYLLIFLCALSSATAYAEDELKIPRFVSLKSAEVNMRSGPGIEYPITWVYKRRHMPVEIIEEYENWRKIRDFEGDTGWIFRAMIEGERHAIIKGSNEALYRRPDSNSPILLRAEEDVIGKLEACREEWCQLEIDDMKGWIKRAKIYGAYKDEEF